VRGFGEQVFDIIEGAPERLRELNGIAEVRARGTATGCDVVARAACFWRTTGSPFAAKASAAARFAATPLACA